MSLKIEIDRALCGACDVCTQIAPNTFQLDEENLATVIDPNGDPKDTILAAATDCPLEVITVHDAETGEKLVPPP